jgi:hypothetical protein
MHMQPKFLGYLPKANNPELLGFTLDGGFRSPGIEKVFNPKERGNDIKVYQGVT